jgi:hypothetical protein
VKTVSVYLRCNDRHGDFEGCVRSIQVEDDFLSLEAVALDRPPRVGFVQFGNLTRLVRISGRLFPVVGYTHCYPVPSDDELHMETAVAAELLNFAKLKGAFMAEGGRDGAGEIWRREGREFSAADLEEVVWSGI